MCYCSCALPHPISPQWHFDADRAQTYDWLCTLNQEVSATTGFTYACHNLAILSDITCVGQTLVNGRSILCAQLLSSVYRHFYLTIRYVQTIHVVLETDRIDSQINAHLPGGIIDVQLRLVGLYSFPTQQCLTRFKVVGCAYSTINFIVGLIGLFYTRAHHFGGIPI